MGMALDTVGGRVTNPSTTITAYTPNTNDGFNVRAFNLGDLAAVISVWGLGATAGIQQLRSPRLHDTTRGMRHKLLAGDSRPVYSRGAIQPLYPQDTLTFEASGGASETDSGAFLAFYQNLPGVSANLITLEQMRSRFVNYTTVETTHTTGATLGDWSGSVAINTAPYLLKANTDYAVLGFDTDTTITSVAISGPDTGNLRCGSPGTSIRTATREWFSDLNRWTGLPTIPVINAANGGGTFIWVQHNASSATVVVDTLLVELR